MNDIHRLNIAVSVAAICLIQLARGAMCLRRRRPHRVQMSS